MHILRSLGLRTIMILLAAGLVGPLMLVTQTAPPANKSSKKKNRQIDPSSTAAPRGVKGSSIEGTVLKSNGTPAGGVQVTLTTSDDDATQRWTTKSDDAGHFRFTGTIPPGDYVATASAGDLASNPTKVSWPGDSTALRLELHSKSSDKGTKSSPE